MLKRLLHKILLSWEKKVQDKLTFGYNAYMEG